MNGSLALADGMAAGFLSSGAISGENAAAGIGFGVSLGLGLGLGLDAGAGAVAGSCSAVGACVRATSGFADFETGAGDAVIATATFGAGLGAGLMLTVTDFGLPVA